MKKNIDNIKTEWYRYIIEILVVVIGIMVAFSLESWQDRKKDSIERQELYGDFIQELEKDLFEIKGNIEFNQRFLSMYERASEIVLNDDKMALQDSLGVLSLGLMDFSDFQKSATAYDLLGASGKLDMINNKSVLFQLQDLGMKYNYINRLETNQQTLIFQTAPQLFEYISMKPFSVKKPEALYSYQFHNVFQIYIRLGIEKHDLYEETRLMLEHLIIDMRKELD